MAGEIASTAAGLAAAGATAGGVTPSAPGAGSQPAGSGAAGDGGDDAGAGDARGAQEGNAADVGGGGGADGDDTADSTYGPGAQARIKKLLAERKALQDQLAAAKGGAGAGTRAPAAAAPPPTWDIDAYLREGQDAGMGGDGTDAGGDGDGADAAGAGTGGEVAGDDGMTPIERRVAVVEETYRLRYETDRAVRALSAFGADEALEQIALGVVARNPNLRPGDVLRRFQAAADAAIDAAVAADPDLGDKGRLRKLVAAAVSQDIRRTPTQVIEQYRAMLAHARDGWERKAAAQAAADGGDDTGGAGAGADVAAAAAAQAAAGRQQAPRRPAAPPVPRAAGAGSGATGAGGKGQPKTIREAAEQVLKDINSGKLRFE